MLQTKCSRMTNNNQYPSRTDKHLTWRSQQEARVGRQKAHGRRPSQTYNAIIRRITDANLPVSTIGSIVYINDYTREILSSVKSGGAVVIIRLRRNQTGQKRSYIYICI